MSNLKNDNEFIKKAFEEINFSNHALKRISLRKINKNIIKTCLEYGNVFYKTGIKFYVLLKKNILKYKLDQKLEGICILQSNDNTIITVYKNKEIGKKIKSLSKRKSTRKNTALSYN